MRRILSLLTLLTFAATAAVVTPSPDPSAAAGPTAPPFVAFWGLTSGGTGPGEFSEPRGVAVDRSGTIYIADSGNDRVQKFSADGAFLAEWGSEGTDPGEFQNPMSIAVDATGGVYVGDTGNARIQKFDSNGTFLTEWGECCLGQGNFSALQGLAVGGSGNLYQADGPADRVQVFTSAGGFVREFGAEGSGEGEFENPEGVGVSAGDDVYVADTGNDRIQQFTADGTFVREWGTSGTGEGEFDDPVAVTVDGTGDVWVTDWRNDRIQVFTADGTFKFSIGSNGSGPGNLIFPYGVAVSRKGSVYVADMANNRISRWARPLPDLRIRRGVSGPLAGNNLYNTTGAGQNRSGAGRAGAIVNFYASIQNDVPESEAFRLQGQGGTPRFTVRYFAGPANITAAVVAGTYTTTTLAPGTVRTIRVQVTIRASAPIGASLVRTLTGRADSDLDRRDTVRFTTTRT